MSLGVTEKGSIGEKTLKTTIGVSGKGSVGEKDIEKERMIKTYKDLDVFKRAMDLTVEIFERTKRFPKEETYSLTDQIRRSSRSICANIGEAWRKRRYQAAFIAKLNDAETEACETQVWIEIAHRCKYLSQDEALAFDKECNRIISQIISMINKAESWTIR